MQLKLRKQGHESAGSEATRLQAIERFVPAHLVDQILEKHHRHEKRCRKLAMRQIVYLVLAMNLFSRDRLALVLERLWHVWHWWFAPEKQRPPTDAAIHYRREQLGIAPVKDLFRQVCRPLATQQTRGAFLYGARTMAVDSKCINLPDTQPIDHHFGRPGSDRGAGAFPQARLATLQEVGTHATVDAEISPVHTSEHKTVRRLLRSVTAGMLVLFDRGLYSFALIAGLRRRGAHVLCRLPAEIKPRPERLLSDGTWLVRIARPSHCRSCAKAGMLLRMITYTFEDPNNPGHHQTYRLLTTWLDPQIYPGQELAQSYHERWDIEEGYDELETHLLKGSAPLRSRSVSGIVQEIYGMLLAHYAIRALMHEAALKAQIDPDTISFTATLILLQEVLHDFQLVSVDCHPVLWARCLREIACHRVQSRLPRTYPRVVKRKMSKFPLKRAATRGHTNCLPYREAIRLI